jgi:hypothetical protein
MTRGVVPTRSWFARLARAALPVAMAIAPVVAALLVVSSAGRRSAFHCLMIRTDASRGAHVELCGDQLDVMLAGLEKQLCNVPQMQPGQWAGFRRGATHPGKTFDPIAYSGGVPLVATYRGSESFLWVTLDLGGLFILSLLVWLVVLGRWLFRTRRNRLRIEQRFCPACGYDLRASPARCPECGADAIPADAAETYA